MGKFPFNVRVYVLITDPDRNQVILSDELIKGHQIIKFPGGGLEFGEGTADCALREISEELGLDVSRLEHIYTTDFFIRSAFNPDHQVVSIYYTAIAPDPVLTDEGLAVHLAGFQHPEAPESFRWELIRELEAEHVTFPGDRAVIEKIRQLWLSGA